MQDSKNILLVDDDELFADMLQKQLTRSGYTVVRARNGREAIRLYDRRRISLVLTDLVMPDMEGLELIMKLREFDPGIRIVAMSGGGRNRPDTYLNMARQLGATTTLAKPFSSDEMFAAIEGLVNWET